MTGAAPQFVQEVSTPLPGTAKYDVVMCGGTLGIFLACALQLQGLRCGCLHAGSCSNSRSITGTSVTRAYRVALAHTCVTLV